MTPFRPRAAAALLAGLTLIGAQGVDTRHAHQQSRVGHGVASGRLTPHEASRIEHQQGRIDRTEARDRASNGGHLTPTERTRLQSRENRASAHISRAKHNGRTS